MANKNDLRYRRTENAIRSTFLELLHTNSLHKISVSTVCRQAGISRNAFYQHHASIAALSKAIIDDLAEQVFKECQVSGDILTKTKEVDALFPTKLFKAFCDNEMTLRALFSSDEGPLARHLILAIKETYVRAGRAISENADSDAFRAAAAFAASAQGGLLMHWLKDTDRPLTEALPIFRELQGGIAPVISRILLENDDALYEE